MTRALDPTRSISVAASAGSGKTWQLVSRIVRLLLAGAEPGGILALTFTRKAASEMRERVEARLREIAYADDETLAAALTTLGLDDAETVRAKARGLHERLLFEPFGLRAQTLHVFCHDVLTRFAVEAEVPAGFTLIENESDASALALDRLLEHIRQKPTSREALALDQLVSLGASETVIRGWLAGFVTKRSDWWAYTEAWRADGQDLVSAASASVARDLELDPDDERDPDAAFDEPDFVMQLVQLHDLLVDCKGLGGLKSDLIAEALTASDAGSRGASASRLLTATGGRRKFSIKKGVTEATFDRCSRLYEALCVALEQVNEQHARRATLLRTTAIFTLGASLLDELAKQLRAQNALTFADLEWRTYRLLRDPERADWVRYKLDRRLEHLLLDEFQDTSPTQWSLLLPLLEEMAAGDTERSRTAFIVGDAKQSIYGFRRANPELMDTARDYIENDLRGEAMPLNDSRRSAPAVIDFVNALFEGERGAAIRFDTHGTWRTTDWGAVEIAPLVRADNDDVLVEPAAGLRYPLTTARVVAEDLRLHTEAQQIAERIVALVDARLPILDGREVRALGRGDIMILARQRTHLYAIEQALAGHGIGFAGSSKGTLLDTVIAQDLMALLRFLDAPHRDLEFAQTLRSPLFGASDDDLVLLASLRAQGASWWSRLQSIVATKQANETLTRAARLIEGWLAAARTLPAHDLLDRIDHEAGAATRYEAALPHDARVRANLGAFLQLVLDADQGRYPTLGRLNRRLEELAASGKEAPDEAPPPSEGGVVRVMTIHASKGLEAPAVFIVNSAPTPRASSENWLVEWPSGSGRPTHYMLAGKTAERDAVSTALAAQQKARDEREALNLLYVAVTRARQFLFVSAFESKKNDPQGTWHAYCRAAVARLAADRESAAEALPGAPDDAVGHRSGAFPAAPAPIETTAVEQEEDVRLQQRFSPQAEAAAAPSFDPAGLRDPDSAARGVAIHWLLQQFANARDSEPSLLSARLGAVLDRAPEAGEFAQWLTEARRVIEAPALAAFFDATQFRRAWNEQSIQSTFDGELMSGIIDRLVDDGETLWILDYKTAPRPQPASMIEHYRPQLSAYADTVAKLWPGRAVVAGLVLTATASWVEVLRR